MKTLHAHLIRQSLGTILLTVAVFAFVLLLGNILKEIFTLLLNDRASFKTVALAVGALIPYILAYALPMGLLTAMLLTFGRLSADQELTAIRSGGVSIVTLVTPALLLSLALSLICAYVNMDIAPRCRAFYKDILYELGNQRPTSILVEGQFIKDIPKFIIYVGKIEGENLHNILITKMNDQGDVEMNLQAPRGNLVRQENPNQFLLTLFESTGVMWMENRWQPVAGDVERLLTMPSIRAREPKINEMTFLELLAEKSRVQQLLASAKEFIADAGNENRTNARSLLQNELEQHVSKIRVQLHHQAAFSFACFGFTLLGIPLGIRSHRKETSIGTAIALILILVYYSFFILAGALSSNPQYHPYLFCWIPNFLFQISGAILLIRADRS